MNQAQTSDDENALGLGPDHDLDGDESATDDERRRDFRHLACFPAHLHAGPGVARSALIRDLSVSGALLLTRARFAVGAPIELSLYLDDGSEAFKIAGNVVRSARRSGELAHPWTMSLAVRFTRPLTEIEPQIKALAVRQAALFGRDAGK